MASHFYEDLEPYQTPKERLRNAFWMGLRVVVLCYMSWGLSVYSIKFWENPRPLRLIVPVLVAVLLAYTVRMCLPYRRRWWPIYPAIVALAAPVALHAFGVRGVQIGAAYAVAILLPLPLVLAIVHWGLRWVLRRREIRRLMWRMYLGALGASELVLLVTLIATNSRQGFEGFLFWQLIGPATLVFGFTDS
jgi:hypothetical protein